MNKLLYLESIRLFTLLIGIICLAPDFQIEGKLPQDKKDTAFLSTKYLMLYIDSLMVHRNKFVLLRLSCY